MPSEDVLHKYKHGTLHSGSKRGPKVKSRKQAIAIMLSERRAEKAGKGHGKRRGYGRSARKR